MSKRKRNTATPSKPDDVDDDEGGEDGNGNPPADDNALFGPLSPEPRRNQHAQPASDQPDGSYSSWVTRSHDPSSTSQALDSRNRVLHSEAALARSQAAEAASAAAASRPVPVQRAPPAPAAAAIGGGDGDNDEDASAGAANGGNGDNNKKGGRRRGGGKDGVRQTINISDDNSSSESDKGGNDDNDDDDRKQAANSSDNDTGANVDGEAARSGMDLLAAQAERHEVPVSTGNVNSGPGMDALYKATEMVGRNGQSRRNTRKKQSRSQRKIADLQTQNRDLRNRLQKVPALLAQHIFDELLDRYDDCNRDVVPRREVEMILRQIQTLHVPGLAAQIKRLLTDTDGSAPQNQMFLDEEDPELISLVALKTLVKEWARSQGLTITMNDLAFMNAEVTEDACSDDSQDVQADQYDDDKSNDANGEEEEGEIIQHTDGSEDGNASAQESARTNSESRQAELWADLSSSSPLNGATANTAMRLNIPNEGRGDEGRVPQRASSYGLRAQADAIVQRLQPMRQVRSRSSGGGDDEDPSDSDNSEDGNFEHVAKADSDSDSDYVPVVKSNNQNRRHRHRRRRPRQNAPFVIPEDVDQQEDWEELKYSSVDKVICPICKEFRNIEDIPENIRNKIEDARIEDPTKVNCRYLQNIRLWCKDNHHRTGGPGKGCHQGDDDMDTYDATIDDNDFFGGNKHHLSTDPRVCNFGEMIGYVKVPLEGSTYLVPRSVLAKMPNCPPGLGFDDLISIRDRFIKGAVKDRKINEPHLQDEALTKVAHTAARDTPANEAQAMPRSRHNRMTFDQIKVKFKKDFDEMIKSMPDPGEGWVKRAYVSGSGRRKCKRAKELVNELQSSITGHYGRQFNLVKDVRVRVICIEVPIELCRAKYCRELEEMFRVGMKGEVESIGGKLWNKTTAGGGGYSWETIETDGSRKPFFLDFILWHEYVPGDDKLTQREGFLLNGTCLNPTIEKSCSKKRLGFDGKNDGKVEIHCIRNHKVSVPSDCVTLAKIDEDNPEKKYVWDVENVAKHYPPWCGMTIQCGKCKLKKKGKNGNGRRFFKRYEIVRVIEAVSDSDSDSGSGSERVFCNPNYHRGYTKGPDSDSDSE